MQRLHGAAHLRAHLRVCRDRCVDAGVDRAPVILEVQQEPKPVEHKADVAYPADPVWDACTGG